MIAEGAMEEESKMFCRVMRFSFIILIFIQGRHSCEYRGHDFSNLDK